MTERAAARLPEPPDVLELDVNSEADWQGLRRGARASAGAGSTAPCTRSPSPRRRARRRLPRDALRERGHRRLPDQRLLLRRHGRRTLTPLMEEGRQPRRPRLRRHRRLAVLRLDGRLQGGARGGQPLPGARPRHRSASAQPGLRRPDRHRRGQRHPRLRGARRPMGAQAPLGWEADRRRPRSPTPRSSCSPTSPAGSPARSSTSTAACTRSAPRPRARTSPPAQCGRRTT